MITKVCRKCFNCKKICDVPEYPCVVTYENHQYNDSKIGEYTGKVRCVAGMWKNAEGNELIFSQSYVERPGKDWAFRNIAKTCPEFKG